MDLSSISVNTHVTRSHDLKPISVQLKLMSRKHPDPQRPLKMVAVVTPSACSGIDMQEVHNNCGISVWCFGKWYLDLSSHYTLCNCLNSSSISYNYNKWCGNIKNKITSPFLQQANKVISKTITPPLFWQTSWCGDIENNYTSFFLKDELMWW